MKLKSFGCSFIFGTDLSDSGGQQARPIASKLTWPSHVANYLGVDYESYARPGSGNLQIMESVINQACADEPAVFVIGWSYIDRYDIYDIGWTGRYTLSPWSSITPMTNSDAAKTYFRHLHSQYRDKLVSLSYIKSTIDILKQKNIKFVMTYMDSLLFETVWHSTPAVKHLQEYIKPYMTEFEGKNFLAWSREKGFAESDTWHPLEQAHQAAADYMIKVFDKQKTNDPIQPVLS